jgi:fructose PTS system EIIBC or EIIC component
LKKKLTDEEYAGGSVEEEEAEVDLSGISFE